MSDKKADAIRSAEKLNDQFSYITPKTDVPTPEQYFGLPKSPKPEPRSQRGRVMPDIVSLDDYRPHDAAYVACMKCAHDWVAVFPPPAVPLECPSCAAMAGEPVDHQNVEWFKRFMAGKDREKRTLILLNAARMALR